MWRFADQKFDVELKVRDLGEIALKHCAIAREAERPAVVTGVVGDEAMQIRPILPVEAGDIAAIEVGEGRLGHGDCPWRSEETPAFDVQKFSRAPETVRSPSQRLI